MRRTQIYLDETQAKRLDARALHEGRTRSDLIRTAVDSYLEHVDKKHRMERFREALWAAAGSEPDFDVDSFERSRDASRQRLAEIARLLDG